MKSNIGNLEQTITKTLSLILKTKFKLLNSMLPQPDKKLTQSSSQELLTLNTKLKLIRDLLPKTKKLLPKKLPLEMMNMLTSNISMVNKPKLSTALMNHLKSSTDTSKVKLHLLLKLKLSVKTSRKSKKK
jgi:hypothetical protein